MKALSNPFAGLEGYHCFGCSPDNPSGLKLIFFEEGDNLIAEWVPRHDFQGYRDVLHGGIQATLIDEIASWVIYVKLKTGGVTAKIEVKYRIPISIIEPKVILKAKLLGIRRNLADVVVELFNSKGEMCTKGQATFFLPSDSIVRASLLDSKLHEINLEENSGL